MATNKELLGTVIDMTVKGQPDEARAALSQYMEQKMASMIKESKDEKGDEDETEDEESATDSDDE